MSSTSAFGLGMGAATADSYIGEPLSIHIPIFNVKKPNDLSVLLQKSGGSSAIVSLKAAVERKNSQLAIRISSDQQTNEPYISFVLEVVDDGDSTSKEFTVLLDLAPPGNSSPTFTNQNRSASSNVNRLSRDIGPSNVVNLSTNRLGSVMGPYDWAQAGQVADSFGPVLDGQSLWRVARRINKALGVSVDQMMWSLYQNNRDQFSNDSISSLQAGAVLKIPTAQQASQISELQAKANIERFSTAQVSAPLSDESSVSRPVSPEPDNQPVEQTQSQSVDAPPFQLTGFDSDGKSSGQGAVTDGGKSQEIIASLAEAVGNLTQEVIKKDRKISFLEEKVAALEEYAKVSASDLPGAPQESLSEINSSDDSQVPKPEVQESEVGQVAAPVNAAPAEPVINTDTNSISEQPSEGVMDTLLSLKPWHWLLVILFICLILAILFRQYLFELVSSLNLFSDEEKIEFDPSEYHHVDSEYHLDNEFSMPSTDPDLTVENSKPQNGLSQKSILDAIKNAVKVEDPLSPQTILDLDGDFSHTEMLDDNDDDALSFDEADLTFLERFNKALAKEDQSFALQLLDMARGNEIDNANYHYHRLRMYESMHNEDAFYDYFCEIENDIPSFPSEMQTKISQLVLQMAQQ